MTREILETISPRVWDLARRQHGVISRSQLLALGLTHEAIEHRLKRGRIHRSPHRGVYLIGWPLLTSERRWMAAVLACGKQAMLSHRSAAALWGFGKETPGVIHVSIARHSSLRRQGLRIHDRPGLRNRDMTTRLGIPLTAPVKTFLDFTTVAGPKTVERAINEADKLDVIDADALRRALDDHPGEPGVRP
ncbi:MAG TPA: type IV toxin-antitoxin system AbiEi family antitoxin domain-containing protein, partial [Solirubrobacterales bacterium]|nr:type IV toxin-antitoxin system AbiEi family antitoxin domain-containing protein [Solirubrobacterales bacterium]